MHLTAGANLLNQYIAARAAQIGTVASLTLCVCQASKTAFRSYCARPTGRYSTCERGVLSEFRAARTCASYWFDKHCVSFPPGRAQRLSNLLSTRSLLSHRAEQGRIEDAARDGPCRGDTRPARGSKLTFLSRFARTVDGYHPSRRAMRALLVSRCDQFQKILD